MRTVLVEGASTAFGLYDSFGGWASRLHSETMDYNKAHCLDPVVVQSKATPGKMLTAMAPSLLSDIKYYSRLGPVRCVISAGLNESKIVKQTNRPIVDPVRFGVSLCTLLNSVVESGTSPIVVGPQAVRDNGQGYLETNSHYIENDLTEEYAEFMRMSADEYEVPYVDVRALFAYHDVEKVISDDDIHPTSFGHELIAAAVMTQLKATGLFATDIS